MVADMEGVVILSWDFNLEKSHNGETGNISINILKQSYPNSIHLSMISTLECK